MNSPEQNGIEFYTPPKHQKDFSDFRSIYDQVMITICPDEKMKHIGQQGRICRFCKRAYPLATFRKDAHVIPHFLGNKFLISEDECDTCNELFARYENDFKNYLGIIPTLTKTVGKSNSFPTFKTREGDIRAAKSDRLKIDGDYLEIFKRDLLDKSLEFDFEKGEGRSVFKKYPYIPYHVYKCLLKVAFSCLPIQYLVKYKNAIHLLRANSPFSVQLIPVHITHFPLDGINAPKPFVYIFSKRSPEINAPSHLAMLFYQGLIFQFFLPLSDNDNHLYKSDNNVLIHFCPPLFTFPVDDNVLFTSEIVDFSFSGKRKNEVQALQFNITVDKDKPFYCFNPKTGKHKLYEHQYPKDIVGIVTAPRGTILSKESFGIQPET